METVSINQAMDDFFDIVNTAPPEDAVTRLVRRSGHYGNLASLEALARLLVVETARRKCAEAKVNANR